MLIDSEWEEVEMLQMRTPDRRSMRIRRSLEEMEHGKEYENDAL
jgi:hypothetical protein